MRTNQSSMDFEDGRRPLETFILFEYIITDRGSKYSVSGGFVESTEDIKTFLHRLKAPKKYAKATHHSYAARITRNGSCWETKNDDGETGAGAVILRIMQRENLSQCVIVVTRWFGGIQLHADRFKHISDSTKYFIGKL